MGNFENFAQLKKQVEENFNVSFYFFIQSYLFFRKIKIYFNF